MPYLSKKYYFVAFRALWDVQEKCLEKAQLNIWEKRTKCVNKKIRSSSLFFLNAMESNTMRKQLLDRKRRISEDKSVNGRNFLECP